VTQITVTGLTPTNKAPGFYARVISPSGRSSSAAFLLTLLLVGLKTSGGSLTADTGVVEVFSEEEADTYAGAGSELACMVYDALQITGVRIKIATPTAAGGAVAGACTITFTGTPAAGTFRWRAGGDSFEILTSASDTLTTIAAKVAAAQAAKSRNPITGTSSVGVATLTCKTAGARGNQHIVFIDTSGLPAGLNAALAGGTAVTGGGVPLTGGSGNEDVTNLTTTLTPGLYDILAVAQNEVTNLGRWKTYLNAKAAATEMRLEALVFSTNGSYSAAVTISTNTTNCNFTRFNHLWMLNGETHPSRVAAVFGAIRSVTEQSDPSPRYMFTELTGVKPHSQSADVPINSVIDGALNNGVSPITTKDGVACVARGITTYCLNGAAPDDRALDINTQSMPDYALKALALIWNTDVAVNYVRVMDNPDLESAEDIPERTIYPNLWNDIMIRELKTWEKNGWVTEVDTHLPTTIFNDTADRLMFECPIFPSRGNYQAGGNIRQVSA
jgi:phage tail sheath gpL-like